MTGAIRTEAVETLSARSELLSVMRVAMAVVVIVWTYVALTTGAASGAGPRNMLPFQRLVADRPFDEQRMFRELQEGLLEAEAVRAQDGSWPLPSVLADAGVPPFAPDPTRKIGYTWNLIASGGMVNYLGVADHGAAPAWLLLIQEPTPGVPPDQTFEDEEHHRLATGEMLHVSEWVHTSGNPEARIVRMPQAEGWLQIYAVGPSAAPVPTR
ncbi:MAG: hypothetical protein QM736_13420 [Vicinamibacterales bacterium]